MYAIRSYYASWLVSEGGNREFNGSGTLMMTWAVEKQRNPEIATSLLHYPNAKNNVDDGTQRKRNNFV